MRVSPVQHKWGAGGGGYSWNKNLYFRFRVSRSNPTAVSDEPILARWGTENCPSTLSVCIQFQQSLHKIWISRAANKQKHARTTSSKRSDRSGRQPNAIEPTIFRCTFVDIAVRRQDATRMWTVMRHIRIGTYRWACVKACVRTRIMRHI